MTAICLGIYGQIFLVDLETKTYRNRHSKLPMTTCNMSDILTVAGSFGSSSCFVGDMKLDDFRCFRLDATPKRDRNKLQVNSPMVKAITMRIVGAINPPV